MGSPWSLPAMNARLQFVPRDRGVFDMCLGTRRSGIHHLVGLRSRCGPRRAAISSSNAGPTYSQERSPTLPRPAVSSRLRAGHGDLDSGRVGPIYWRGAALIARSDENGAIRCAPRAGCPKALEMRRWRLRARGNRTRRFRAGCRVRSLRATHGHTGTHGRGGPTGLTLAIDLGGAAFAAW